MCSTTPLCGLILILLFSIGCGQNGSSSNQSSGNDTMPPHKVVTGNSQESKDDENKKSAVFKKSLPNGDLIRLYKEESLEHRESRQLGPKSWIVGGEFIVLDHTLALWKGGEAAPTTIWKHKCAFEKDLKSSFNVPVFRMLDVLIDEDEGYVLYVCESRIQIDVLTEADDGSWTASTSFEFSREGASGGGYVTAGRLIGFKRAIYAAFEYAHGRVVEFWSLGQEKPELLYRSKYDKLHRRKK